MKVITCVVLALVATAIAFPSVEEFEIIEDEIEDDAEEVAEEIFNENRLFDLVSKIEPNPEKATRLTSFVYKDCGGPSAMVNINAVSVTPDPLSFPGPLYLATNFKINSNLDTPLKGEVLLYKEILGKFIKIPCIDNVGSCTYDDLCELLEQVQCPDPIVKIGIDCLCPLKANSYTLPKSEFDVNISGIPKGSYHAIGNATMNGKEGACLDITITLG